MRKPGIFLFGMSWRQKIMDYKDLMLWKARELMQTTARTLEKILDDDDDMILSARVVGDTDGDNSMSTETQQTEETAIQKIRREKCAQISELAYRRTPEEVEAWFLDQTWIECPAVLHERIEKFFTNPRHFPLPDRNRIDLLSEDALERIEKIDQIKTLLAALRKADRSHDLPYLMKVHRERYERVLRSSETPIETARRHAFTMLAGLTGKPQKRIAKVYDAIDWKDPIRWDEKSQTGRFAVVYEFLFADLPQPKYYRREPDNEAEHKRRRAETEHVWAANQRAKDLVWPVIKVFENLRAEVATWRREQDKKAAHKAQLEKQIAKAKAQLAAHDQAA